MLTDMGAKSKSIFINVRGRRRYVLTQIANLNIRGRIYHTHPK
jgi:hypothetical protein